MDKAHTTQQVRQFYDRIGWQEGNDGIYQNARYEDLRPVSIPYISRCHLRVNRYLPPGGHLLMDAGSGPIQYPQYLTYSTGYNYRVCVDISIVAIQHARKRIKEHGLYVVADVANLPFVDGAFDGIVSLHTLHHVSHDDQKKGYHEFYRLLKPTGSSVVVNGWSESPLMRFSLPMIRIMERLMKDQITTEKNGSLAAEQTQNSTLTETVPTGTFVSKLNVRSLKTMLAGMDFEIRCWRSVSVRFLRAMIHPALLGRFWLWVLFGLETLFPGFFGEKGQYPLVVIHKP